MTVSRIDDGGAVFDFADGKDPKALRTIGEVSEALGIRQHVLRYWEEQFPALSPVKRSGGRRYYRPEDIALIARIDRLVHREGYTLKGARMALQAGITANPDEVKDHSLQESVSQEPELIFDSIQNVRDMLARALAKA